MQRSTIISLVGIVVMGLTGPSETARAYYSKAVEYHQRKDYQAAVQQLNLSIQEAPDF